MAEGGPQFSLWDNRNPDQQTIVLYTPTIADRLKRERAQLVQVIRAERLWVHLQQYGVVDIAKKEELQHNAPNMRVVERLLDDIDHGPCWRFHGLMKALYETHQEHVLDLLSLDRQLYTLPDDLAAVPPEVTYCSFTLVEKFPDGCSNLDSPAYHDFKSITEREVKCALEKCLYNVERIQVLLLCHGRNVVFLEVVSRQRIPGDPFVAVLKDLVIRDESTEYHVDPETVLTRGQKSNALALRILKQRHLTHSKVDRKIDLDTQYVALRLIPSDEWERMSDVDDSEKPDSYQSRLEMYHGHDIKEEELVENGEYRKFVLIRGGAGIGKSTLVQHLLRKWACGEWAPHLKLLFLLDLRWFACIPNEISLSELFNGCAVHRTGAICIGEDWLSEHEMEVGVILDGIDEVSNFENELQEALEDATDQLCKADYETTSLRLCLHLLNRQCLSDCTLIVTSRPFGKLKLIKPTVKVEMMGLTKRDVVKFVDKNVAETRRDHVKQALTNYPILMSVCSITFYCACLCKLLETEGAVTGGLKTYTQITFYILEQYMTRSTRSMPEYFEGLSSSLKAFAELAFLGLFAGENRRLTFLKEHLEEVNIKPFQVKDMCQAGVFLQNDQYTADQDGDDQESRKVQSFGEFVHLSIQEFLAVLGLLIRGPTNTSEIFARVFQSQRLVMAKYFLFGLLFNKNYHKMERIVGPISLSQKEIDRIQAELEEALLTSATRSTTLHDVQCIHESSSERVAQRYATTKMKNSVALANQNLTAVEINGLVFTLKHHPSLESLSASYVNLDALGMKGLVEIVNSSPTLHTLCVEGKGIDEQCLEVLADDLRHNEQLKVLRLGYGPIGPEGITSIKTLLGKTPSLQDLSLRGFSLSHDQVMCMMQELVQQECCSKVLQTMYLYSDEMTDISAIEIATVLTENTSLKHFGLLANNLTYRAILNIAAAIEVNTVLTEFQLWCHQLTDEGVEVLAKAFHRNSTIDLLHLSSSVLTDIGIQHLAGMMKANQKLRVLWLWIHSVTEKGVEFLAEGLKTNAEMTVYLRLVEDPEELATKYKDHKNITIRKWPGKINDKKAEK